MYIIADGTPVKVIGYTDPDTQEQEDRAGVVVSGGHSIEGKPYYEVQIDGVPFPALVPASRLSPIEPVGE